MKKMLVLAGVLLGVVMIMVAADFRPIPALLDLPARKCSGYTIIEFDKGINCDGDTISLVRKHGFAQPVRH